MQKRRINFFFFKKGGGRENPYGNQCSIEVPDSGGLLPAKKKPSFSKVAKRTLS